MPTEVRCFRYFISRSKYLSDFHQLKKIHWINSIVFLIVDFSLLPPLSSQLKEQHRYGRFSPWPWEPEARMGSPSLPSPFLFIMHCDYLKFALKMFVLKMLFPFAAVIILKPCCLGDFGGIWFYFFLWQKLWFCFRYTLLH